MGRWRSDAISQFFRGEINLTFIVWSFVRRNTGKKRCFALYRDRRVAMLFYQTCSTLGGFSALRMFPVQVHLPETCGGIRSRRTSALVHMHSMSVDRLSE